jgi:hypothetical protein
MHHFTLQDSFIWHLVQVHLNNNSSKRCRPIWHFCIFVNRNPNHVWISTTIRKHHRLLKGLEKYSHLSLCHQGQLCIMSIFLSADLRMVAVQKHNSQIAN